ncbi:uncharacterized protein F4822DRAFT_395830 [Hypoxylon trugodes]|uniref:uncharacterized protein n=1 Tax=Hypoxylon trugodes TaxID=326681 RepID=UPI00218E5F44|nr:uncharacterized protein F4822DRAFT_395830 [Hypoxylon trugodes]KAI1391164.1 hypothetical protein F4822DRAFT_395830 [Hypoxylon trugodes]
MLAARGQENLTFNRQNNAALKQQGQAKHAKTPLKVPLNDENAAGGAKSILAGKTRGNENQLTSKGAGLGKSNLATPSGQPSRAPLGNKTTNAKAKGQQTVNVKSAIREIEKSNAKQPTTTRPKPKHPHSELQKLGVFPEETELSSEDEYCPPVRYSGSPYRSETLPDGTIRHSPVREDNFKNNLWGNYLPVDAFGVPPRMGYSNSKAKRECNKEIIGEMNNIKWGLKDESEASKKQASASGDLIPDEEAIAERRRKQRNLNTLRLKKAVDALPLEDTTKSAQRQALKSANSNRAPSTSKKTTAIPIPSFKRQPSVRSQAQPQGIPRKTSMEIEANSRTTIGYNKGRSISGAVTLAQKARMPSNPVPRTGFSRSNTTISNNSDETITPARYANSQVSAAEEDEQWKEKVPFLSIFNPEQEINFDEEDDDDFDLLAGSKANVDDDDFAFKLSE